MKETLVLGVLCALFAVAVGEGQPKSISDQYDQDYENRVAPTPEPPVEVAALKPVDFKSCNCDPSLPGRVLELENTVRELKEQLAAKPKAAAPVVYRQSVPAQKAVTYSPRWRRR